MKKATRQYIVLGLIAVLAVAYLGDFLAPYGLTSPLVTTPTPADKLKSIAVIGSYIGPQGTVYGAVGNAIFYDEQGSIAGSGALSASSAFSVTVPSGKAYIIGLQMTGGNAITYWQNFNTVDVPEYSTDSEVTTWSITPAFIMYPKTVAWTERVTMSTFASGSMSQSYTANAWGGTQTYTAHTPDLYTAIAAGTQYTFTFELTASTTYSQLGWEGSYPNYPDYTLKPMFILWTNRTDWTLAAPGSANAVKQVINGSTTIFIAQIPMVRSNSVAASISVSFTVLTGSAGQGQWGANPVMNSSLSWIQATNDYKVNAPPGYGAVFYGARFVTGHTG